MRFLLLLFLFLAPNAFAQSEPELKSADLKKIAKPAGEWITAQIEMDSEDAMKALEDLDEQIDKLAKKLKTVDPLSLVADWQLAMNNQRKFATSGKKIPKGKLADFDYGLASFSVRLPKKYNPKKEDYPAVYLLGKEGKSLIDKLDQALLEEFVVFIPNISSLSADLVFDMEAVSSVFATSSFGWQNYRLDRSRQFLIGADDLGDVLAAQYLALMPHMFAGASMTSDVVESVSGASNLALSFSNVESDLSKTLAWCTEQTAVSYSPLEFEAELPWAQQGRVYWVQALNFEVPEDDTDKPLPKIKVSVDRASNKITIDSADVTRVKLFLNDEIVNLDNPITVIRNGEEFSYQVSRSVGNMLQDYTISGAIYPAVIREVEMPVVEE